MYVGTNVIANLSCQISNSICAYLSKGTYQLISWELQKYYYKNLDENIT